MAKYEIDLTVLPGLGASGHIDRELGRCRPGEVIEATSSQAKARSWLKPLEGSSEKSPTKKKKSTKKSTSTNKAANDSEAAEAKEE